MGETAISELFGLVRDMKAEITAQTAILERAEAAQTNVVNVVIQPGA